MSMRRTADPVVGYRDFSERDGKTYATAIHKSGRVEDGVRVRVSVDRQIIRADGTIERPAEVASTDDGSVRLAA